MRPSVVSEGNSILAQSKILIADDNIQNCELIDAYLSEEGYELSVAYDGQQAMKRVEELQPDLVLLDIMMPKLSGYEVCQWMKSNARTKDIPVLMVTALNEQGDIEKAVRAGCDDFLTKPVNSLELKTRVKSLLRVRHLTNERDRLLAYMADSSGREGGNGRLSGTRPAGERPVNWASHAGFRLPLPSFTYAATTGITYGPLGTTATRAFGPYSAIASATACSTLGAESTYSFDRTSGDRPFVT